MRLIERRDGVTLDDVICDPEFASELDRIAASIAPGYTPYFSGISGGDAPDSGTSAHNPQFLRRVLDAVGESHW